MVSQLCGARYLIAERGIDNLVGPHVDELGETGVTTLYYDQAFFEALSDPTPLPRERQIGIGGGDVRMVSHALTSQLLFD